MITRPLPDKAKQHLEASNKAKRTNRTLTHIGVYSASYSAKKWIALAESPNFWIDMHGNKYRKADGYPTGVEFPTYKILLDTIHSPT